MTVENLADEEHYPYTTVNHPWRSYCDCLPMTKDVRCEQCYQSIRCTICLSYPTSLKNTVARGSFKHIGGGVSYQLCIASSAIYLPSSKMLWCFPNKCLLRKTFPKFDVSDWASRKLKQSNWFEQQSKPSQGFWSHVSSDLDRWIWSWLCWASQRKNFPWHILMIHNPLNGGARLRNARDSKPVLENGLPSLSRKYQCWSNKYLHHQSAHSLVATRLIARGRHTLRATQRWTWNANRL